MQVPPPAFHLLWACQASVPHHWEGRPQPPVNWCLTLTLQPSVPTSAEPLTSQGLQCSATPHRQAKEAHKSMFKTYFSPKQQYEVHQHTYCPSRIRSSAHLMITKILSVAAHQAPQTRVLSCRNWMIQTSYNGKKSQKVCSQNSMAHTSHHSRPVWAFMPSCCGRQCYRNPDSRNAFVQSREKEVQDRPPSLAETNPSTSPAHMSDLP